jgi:hypothetical protein
MASASTDPANPNAHRSVKLMKQPFQLQISDWTGFQIGNLKSAI